jgi:phage terminase large subunit-like protein
MDPTTALGLVLQEIQRRTEAEQLDQLYQETGPLRRELYVKHMAMFKAGAVHVERATFGGNRVGKSYGIGAYETALHLTGLYPDWWEGRVYEQPIECWMAGTKGIKVRNVNQHFLIGRLKRMQGMAMTTGGFVPGARIIRCTRKQSVSEAVEQVVVRHVKGWENVGSFKSYEEGRTSFEAEGIDWIWLDEEPPKPIYDECKMRILTTKGSMLSTFTPLEGMTETVLALLEDTNLL